MWDTIDTAQIRSAPFPHVVTDRLVSEDHCQRLRDVLAAPDLWMLDADDVHQGFKYAGDLPDAFRRAAGDGPDIVKMARRIAAGFGAPLAQEMKSGILRQLSGQVTKVHNDLPRAARATHRVIFYLDRYGIDYDGGHLNVHARQSDDAIVARYEPVCGGMIGFEASHASYHSVDAITRGQRTAIVFHFYHVGNAPSRIAAIDRYIAGAWRGLGEREARQVKAVASDIAAAYAAEARDPSGNVTQSLLDTAAILRGHEVSLTDTAARLREALRLAPRSELAGHADGADENALTWWAFRLPAQTRGVFTHDKWQKDLAILQALPVRHEGLAALLGEVYPTPAGASA